MTLFGNRFMAALCLSLPQSSFESLQSEFHISLLLASENPTIPSILRAVVLVTLLIRMELGHVEDVCKDFILIFVIRVMIITMALFNSYGSHHHIGMFIHKLVQFLLSLI